MVQSFQRCLLKYVDFFNDKFSLEMRPHVTIEFFLLLSIFFAESGVHLRAAESVNDTKVPSSEVIESSTTNSSTLLNGNKTDTNLKIENTSSGVAVNHGPPVKVLPIFDNGAVKRTFYVVASLTGIVLVYIAVKAIRSSRKRKVRRYGLLIDQEMEPLDGEDEDEDTTLFEANRHKKKGKK